MHITFRVDSSTIIGYGHVMRCLTLAHALLDESNTINKTDIDQSLLISFICRDHQGHINQLILDAHFNLLQLPAVEQKINPKSTGSWLGTSVEQDVQQSITQVKSLPFIDLLIVDHYAIDHKWHKLMKPYYHKLLVLDDLANRLLDCDYLLDQTFNRDKESYLALVPAHCQLLLGQDYILLRNEFSLLKEQAQRRRQQSDNQGESRLNLANILITMGGTDPENLSQLALLSIRELIKALPKVTVNVVISDQSVHLASLTIFCNEHTWANLIINSRNMADLMLSADIAIGASGGTAWERCCLGLPSLTTVNAENQQLIAQNLAQAGATINLGWYQHVTTKAIISAINQLVNNENFYDKMTDACFNICDGQGAKKVAEQLISIPNEIELKLAQSENCELVYRWQSNKQVRKYARNPNIPKWEEHIEWYDSCLQDPNRMLYLLYDYQQSIVGLLRLDHLLVNNHARHTYEISIIVSPVHQGKGIAVSALKKMKTLHRNATYTATIQDKNISSQKAFAKVGFQQVSPEYYQLNISNFQ
jgi:UDP-2,4-diacetamido-2,4,6-trideoxy-beta-L-altropyranose hydrolase